MILPASDTTTGLANSSTPMTQARINAQNQRVAAVGSRFVQGNATMNAIISALTPPPPSSTCSDLTNSNALDGPVSPFPVPTPGGSTVASGTPGAAGPIVLPTPIVATPSSSTTAGTPASSGSVASCFGLSGVRRRRRGFGDMAPYYGPSPIVLMDGTVISSPGTTQPTFDQCLPFQCFADKGNNTAARAWCAWYGFDAAKNPCVDSSCGKWKAYATCPGTPASTPTISTPTPPASTPPPPTPAQVVPTYGNWVMPQFPGFPCAGASSAAAAVAARAAAAAGANCQWVGMAIGAAALLGLVWVMGPEKG
jgi:hypothetical protein